ncbi:MAG: hypothetical protein PHW64_00490 [Sulfuricurvum sp.]|nr:hypothetical protein [Sulfuricurvum sp.]
MKLNQIVTYYLTAFIFVFAIFSFKINLIPLEGSGIRIDDILIFFLLILILFNLRKTNVPTNNKVILLTLLFVVIGFISVFINNYLYHLPLLSGWIYSVRTIEYMIFFYIGYYLANTTFSLDFLMKSYIIYALSLVVLQALNVIPVVSQFGGNRAIANTGGPWELAALIAFAIFYSYIYFENKIYLFASFLILLLTQSRITTFAVLLIFIIVAFKKLTLKKILLIFLVLLIMIVTISFVNLDIIERYLSILNISTYESLIELVESFQYNIDREYYFDMTYGNKLTTILAMEGDSSTLIRFTRWVILIGMTISTPVSTMIGVGPSFAAAAVDGNYVRLFVETGIIGLSLFLYIMYLIYKQTSDDFIMKSYIITIVITALFIDIFTTYKAMVLLWFYYGYLLRKKKNENIILCKI